MMPFWFVIVCAYVLDMIVGDPAWFPHPVRGIGWLIATGEPILRKRVANEKYAGAILAVSVVVGVWGVVAVAIALASVVHWMLGALCSTVFIYTSLAVKDLRDQAMRVYDALKQNDIATARTNVGMIVGRDTATLDEAEIVRATVETVAESTVDGIIAPLFYALLGGAPLALAYKAVNTLDSMIGYKNERYKDFGYVAAKIDDVANFIPARIAAGILPVAAFFIGKSVRRSWETVWRDRKNHPSPNSGIPEAAMAGALGVQLGGTNYYDSVESVKPLIGDAGEPLVRQHIIDSIAISNVSALLIIVVSVIVVVSV